MRKKKGASIKEIPVTDIVPDDKNFNVGNEIGKEMLNRSFSKFGAGRSILLDKNNRTIAGNKSVESYKEAGGKNVIVVEADRNTLIAVKRTDIDLDSAEGREMALADNQTQAVNYVADEDLIHQVAEELDIDTGQWGIVADDDDGGKKIKEENLTPFVKTHVLISFPPEKLLELAPHLEAIKKIRDVEFEQSSN